MPGREIASKSESEVALPFELSTNGVENGPSIDLQRSNSILFNLSAGTITDGTHTFTIEESDDVGFSSPVVLTDDDLRGAVLADLVFSNGVDNKTEQVSVVNNKRFLRLVLTTTGANFGGVVGATAIRQDLSLTPTT